MLMPRTPSKYTPVLVKYIFDYSILLNDDSDNIEKIASLQSHQFFRSPWALIFFFGECVCINVFTAHNFDYNAKTVDRLTQAQFYSWFFVDIAWFLVFSFCSQSLSFSLPFSLSFSCPLKVFGTFCWLYVFYVSMNV